MATPSRNRDPLSRAKVLRAALDLADREGLAAISMRRLGEELGVEAMSLYNHVANKAAILDGIFESMLADLPPAKRSTSWKLALRERARVLRAAMRAHPNAAPLFATRTPFTAAALPFADEVLVLFQQGGLGPAQAVTALHVLVAFVIGHTLATTTTRHEDDTEARARHPHAREAARVLARHDAEAEFEAGVEALLVGFDPRTKK